MDFAGDDHPRAVPVAPAFVAGGAGFAGFFGGEVFGGGLVKGLYGLRNRRVCLSEGQNVYKKCLLQNVKGFVPCVMCGCMSNLYRIDTLFAAVRHILASYSFWVKHWGFMMTLDSVLSLKTDERLLDAVRRASLRKLDANDLMEQRVSFVYGSIGKDDTGITKEQVRKIILEQQGAS